MSAINEVKEQMLTVKSVGDFTNALQQIATIRMVKLRDQVLRSRPFVEAASDMLKELVSIRNATEADDLLHIKARHDKYSTPPKKTNRYAVIVITSNQGLTGSYNPEIFHRVDALLADNQNSDFYVIGKKGQEMFANGKFKVQYYPFEVKDDFEVKDLAFLVKLFDYYAHITLVYSRFINTATRDVVAISVVNPNPEIDEDDAKQPGKYTFEPDIFELINKVSTTLRASLFQQQIFDARLSQFSAQMIGMKASSDNAEGLLADLRLEYNKQRRKLIDKKISEVFAGSALWKS